MKTSIAVALISFIICASASPAQAGVLHKLAHLGLTHKAATVLGAPFFAAGFTFDMVGGLVVLPFKAGQYYFEGHPFVSF